jgi:hypothetical protein
LRITINDCKGNKSEEVEFPVNFTYEESRDLPPEWKDVADNSLGAIMFDLGDLLRKKQRELAILSKIDRAKDNIHQ